MLVLLNMPNSRPFKDFLGEKGRWVTFQIAL